MRTALIDADIVAYRAALQCETEGVDEAERATDWMLRHWAALAEADESICCLSSPKSFRYGLWPDYKKSRIDKPRPVHLSACKEFIRSNYRVAPHHEKLEADDILGILATNGRVENPVIVTIDKDLRQIPGIHHNPDKETTTVISPEQAEEVFLYQWISGDSTDGYPGIPGVGPKKGQRLVEAEDPIAAIIDAYKERGFSMEYALTQARVAKILDASLWDKRRKEVILWDFTPLQAP
jgi:DNA polymerase-1